MTPALWVIAVVLAFVIGMQIGVYLGQRKAGRS